MCPDTDMDTLEVYVNLMLKTKEWIQFWESVQIMNEDINSCVYALIQKKESSRASI